MKPIFHPGLFTGCRSLQSLCLLCILALVVLPGTASATGWLGVSVQDVTPELREAMDLSARSGALVSDVLSDSPAERAGLEPRDVILRVDETAVESAGDLIEAMRGYESGDEVELLTIREDRERRVRLTLGERAEDEKELRWFGRSLPQLVDPLRRLTERRTGFRLGVEVASINRDLAPYFEAEPGRGLLVLRVVEGSIAEDAGIRAGDVLVRFNGEVLSEPGDLVEALGELQTEDRWEILALRQGNEMKMQGLIEAGDLESEPWHGIFGKRQSEPEEIGDGRVRHLERQIDRLEERLRKLERDLRRRDRD